MRAKRETVKIVVYIAIGNNNREDIEEIAKKLRYNKKKYVALAQVTYSLALGFNDGLRIL